MKYAEDFRAIARESLRGRWNVAILTGFVASLIGAGIATGGGGSSSSSNNNSVGTLFRDFQTTDFWLRFRALIIIAIVILAIWLIVTIVISGAGKLGYAIFNLKLVDNKDVSLSDLFSQFHRLGAGFCMNFLMALYTLLWTLLFIIPGIIKGFSYAMTPYILAENPSMTVSEAITKSRRIMDGNKFRLFCLGISFIGWTTLCILPSLILMLVIIGIAANTQQLTTLIWIIPASIPAFIGSLFLTPYVEAANAAFYRDVSGTEVAPATALPECCVEQNRCGDAGASEQFVHPADVVPEHMRIPTQDDGANP